MFHLLLVPIAIGSMFIIFIFYIAIILWIILKMILYIFESIGLTNIAKKGNYKYPYIAWILGISHYILGKYCSDKDEKTDKRHGIIYCILTTIKTIFVILICSTKIIENSTMMLILIIYFIIYYIIDMIYMNKFYKKTYKKPEIFTVLTVITLGMLKPIFIYTAKIKKLTL